jgi:CHAD domain-containing protein
LSAYYWGIVGSIRKNYKSSTVLLSVEGIHDLRVDIKRLRAFFNLIGWINSNFKTKRNFKEIQKLFKAAEKVRDINVQELLVRDRTSIDGLEVSEYYNYLKSKELEARGQFLRSAKKFDFWVFDENWTRIDKATRVFSRTIINKRIEERLKYLIRELNSVKGNQISPGDDFHKLRILSKEARYTLEILRKCIGSDNLLGRLNSSLREVHQILGRWHDNSVGIEWIQSFVGEFSSKGLHSQSSYDRYKMNLTNENQALIAEFEKRWEDFSKKTGKISFLGDLS